MWIPCVDCGSTNQPWEWFKQVQTSGEEGSISEGQWKSQAHSTVMNETPWMNWLILKPTMISHHESGGLAYQTYQTSTHQHHIHRHGIKSMMSCNFAKKKMTEKGSNWATFQYPTLWRHSAEPTSSASSRLSKQQRWANWAQVRHLEVSAKESTCNAVVQSTKTQFESHTYV